MFISVVSERSTNSASATAKIDLSIARTRRELEDAFRLVYNSYTRAGLQQHNKIGLRLVKHHFLPTTEVMIAKKDETVISTATLIVDSELGLPAESMYGDSIDSLRRRGMRLAEVGCLADRRASPARFIQMFRRLSTLISQAAETRGCNGLIAATHPRHARFYIRQLGFEQVGDIRECPYVQGNPAVPLLLDFDAKVGSDIHKHLFGTKYAPSELAPYDWCFSTTDYFRRVMTELQKPLSEQQSIAAQGAGIPPRVDLPTTSTGAFQSS